MSKLNLTPVNIPAYPNNPATPAPRAGDMYYNTGINSMFFYNGTTWQVFQSGGGGSAPDVPTFAWWSE